MKRIFGLILLAALALSLSAGTSPAADAPFSQRYQVTTNGDIAFVANTALTCTGGGLCPRAQAGGPVSNYRVNGAYVDVDSDGGTFQSSRADLGLPASATILRAFLYWGGSSTNAARTTVEFETPAGGGYQTINGSLIGDSALGGARIYSAFADVTSQVQAAGNGTYTVANIQSTTGSPWWAIGGWSMAVVYEDPNEPPRNLTVFDGFRSQLPTSGPSSIPVSGFVTPPSGAVSAKVGVVALGGDRATTGDQLSFNGSPLVDAANPANDSMNGSISVLGSNVTSKSPNYVNQLGFDADILDATGILANGQTSSSVGLQTNGDGFWTTAITTAIEVFAPEIDGSAAKSVVDVNGGDVAPGDILEYTLGFTNTGSDAAINAVLRDAIPANTTYVPNSLELLALGATGSKTDSEDGDEAEFTGSDVVFRLGTGPSPITNVALGGTAEQSSTDFGGVASRAIDGDTNGVWSGGSITHTIVNSSDPYWQVDLGEVYDIEDITLWNRTDCCSGRLSNYHVLLSTTPFGTESLAAAQTHTTFADFFPGTSPVSQTFDAAGARGRYLRIQIAGTGTLSLAEVQIDGKQGGRIDPGETARARFQVQVDAGTPHGTIIPNSAALDFDAESLGTHATTNTNTASVQVAAQPDLAVTKVDAVQVDTGTAGPSPGDTLRYTIVVANNGSGPASGVTLTDSPDANTALVVGSVTATAGTITAGNAAGDTTVAVSIGALAGGASETVTFDVTVDNPLDPGVTSVSNQAVVSSDQLPDLFSDDSDTVTGGDPTTTAVTAAPAVSATKADALVVDADSDGQPSPGDTLEYTVVLTNTGNQNATGITFSDVPGANTALVPGSVTTSAGSITSGNGGGDTAVGVNLGTLLGAGGTATITFRVTIDAPLPGSVSTVDNQAQVSGANIPVTATDDPDTGATGDATSTSVSARPDVEVTKQATLTTDADANGVPSPGDTLTYLVNVANAGNQSAENVTFTDIPGANTSLVVGSVATSAGSVTTGNTPGDTSVAVAIGPIIGGGGSVDISFDVTIAGALPAGVSSVANQGLAAGDNFPDEATDDPATAVDDDPTVTPVTSAPDVGITKTDALLVDADSDGQPSPGDTIAYTVEVTNSGTQGASSLGFNDTPDSNTALVVGSVTTTVGTVTTGNTAGDGSVAVDIGGLAGAGTTATISFNVVIDDPLAAGVTRISNQGVLTQPGLPNTPTDDPATPGPEDATETQLSAAPDLAVGKSVTLAVDADSDGQFSPGDTLLYTLTVANDGNQDAANVVIVDTPDADTRLVVGSVATTAGTVVLGNTTGNSTVQVDVGVLTGSGGGATVTYRTTVIDPLPGVSNDAVNQALVTADGLAPVPSDDPSTVTSSDPTSRPLVGNPEVVATKTDLLLTDADSDGQVSPGDTLTYRVVLRNNGNQAAGSVVFTDTPDANTDLVVGSVATSQGAVTTGNAGGDTTVAVNVGEIPGGGGQAEVTFDVTIDNPLPAGVNVVTNQGTVAGGNFATFSTDDPATATAGDPTNTTVTATPTIEADKTGVVVLDNGDGVPGPGDTLIQTITITNSGNAGATNVSFTDTPDAQAPLVPGSVTTSRGTVLTGNGAGDTAISVNVGALGGGGEQATISYRVTITTPVAPGTTSVTNQGTVTADGGISEPTNDPATAADDDPTVVSFTPTSAIRSEKTGTLSNDADGDGDVSPGDTVTYSVSVQQTGNEIVGSAVFTDTPDPNASLVVGSVTTDVGTVTTGNAGGDTTIAVNLGDLVGLATISYQVVVNDPFPAGATAIDNQGETASSNVATTNTDDPGTAPLDDATSVAVVAGADVEATKAAGFAPGGDANGNGIAEPGERLRYTVTLTNSGNQDADAPTFVDVPDTNTSLVNGSVTTTAGTVARGNTGEPDVQVDVGTIAGRGGTATITFDVDIVAVLPAGVIEVTNQGSITGNNFVAELTDDPATGADDDATVTPVTGSPDLTATKAVALQTDADSSGSASPGDTLRYTIIVTNTGNTASTSTRFGDTPGANTALVAGSVTTTAGTIDAGNGAGDSQVDVDLGTLSGGGGSATITFDVTVDNPVPAGTTSVDNIGLVESVEIPARGTDDPATPALGDPTSQAITAAPDLDVSKRVTLQTDADLDGQPSPGDTLLYQLEVTNLGNTGATGVALTDTPDPNVSLVVGSVATSQGTVTTGNTAGDTSVAVAIGTIAGGGAAETVSYTVLVDNPLGAGEVEAVNQASVASNELPNVSSDDPTTLAIGDPTVSPLVAAPDLRVTKRDFHHTDSDGDGQVSPGDTILYSLAIQNVGNQADTSVRLTDTPDASTTLVAGSVQTNRGTVTIGNGGGDTTVDVAVGTLPGAGAQADISYRVTVNDPLAAGVTDVTNQALVTADTHPNVNSDDPDTVATDDATVVPITARADLSATKTSNDLNGGDLEPGDTVRYTIQITNSGNQQAVGVNVADTPDANTALTGTATVMAGTVNSGDAGDATVDIDVDPLAGRGGSATITFDVVVADPLPGGVTQISNQGTVTATGIAALLTDDPAAPGATDPTVDAITAAPALGVTKTANDANGGDLEPGDTLEYTLTITNTGNQAATAVAVADPRPANTTFALNSVAAPAGATVVTGNAPSDSDLDVTGISVPGGGASRIVTFDVVIDDPIPESVSSVSNQATISASNHADVLSDDPGVGGATDPTVSAITAAPVLGVTKTVAIQNDVDGDTQADPGDTLRYTITITNTGNQEAAGVAVTDPRPSNTTFRPNSVTTPAGATVTSGNGVADTSLDVSAMSVDGGGASISVTFDVIIDTPVPALFATLSNQATISASNHPNVVSDDPGVPGATNPTDIAIDAAPLLAVTKTASLLTDVGGDGDVSPGDTLRYTILMSNSGDEDAGAVVVDDPRPSNVTYSANSVTAPSGSTVNSGDSTADTVVNVSGVTIAGGGSESVVFDVVVNDPLPAGVTSLSNQATISAVNHANVLSDDPAVGGATDPTVTALVASPDVVAEKAAALTTDVNGNGIAEPGDELTYTVTLRNDGDQDAPGIVFTDIPGANTTLTDGSVTTTVGSVDRGNAGEPDVRVSVGTLAGGGGAATISFRATIDSPLPAGVIEVRNQGAYAGSNVPGGVTDDPASAAADDPTTVPVVATPDISAAKTVALSNDANGNGVAEPGDELTYTVTTSNTGSQDATGVVIDDVPDANARLVVGSVSVTTGSGTVTMGNAAGDTQVQVALGTLSGGGGTSAVEYRATIVNPLPAGTVALVNQALVSSDQLPTAPSDDPSTAAAGDATNVGLTSAPQLSATKRWVLVVDANGDGVADPGDTLEYQITVQNSGNQDAADVTVTDTPDPNTDLVVGSVITSQGTVSTGNGGGDTSVQIDFGTITGGGGSASASFRVTVDNPLPPLVDRVDNQATISASNHADVTSDDPTTLPADRTTTIVAGTPNIILTKRDRLLVDADGNGLASPGDTLLYRVVAQNTGNQGAADLILRDMPDANTTLVAGSVRANRGTVDLGNGSSDTSIRVSGVTIPGAGAVAEVTYEVTIDSPLPAGTAAVVNAAEIQNDTLVNPDLPGVLPSDDPDTPATADDTRTAVSAAPAIAADKSVALHTDANGDGVASPGDILRYTVVITNSGALGVADVVFRDPLDANTALVAGSLKTTAGTVGSGAEPVVVNVGTLAGSGGSATITFDVTIDPSTPSTVKGITNQGTVTAAGLPPLVTDDPRVAGGPQATAISISTALDLAITKRAVPAVATVGKRLVYAISVTNNGPSVATNVRVRDPLPRRLTARAASSSHGGTCTRGRIVVCSIPRLASAETATVRIAVIPKVPKLHRNTVGVFTDQADTDATNDEATVRTRVRHRKTRLKVTIRGPRVVWAGSLAYYRVCARNRGRETAYGAVGTYPIPQSVVWAPTARTRRATLRRLRALKPAAVTLVRGGKLRIRLGNIRPGKQVCKRFRVRVTRSATGSFRNRVSVKATNSNIHRTVVRVRTPNRMRTILPAVTG